MDCLVSYRTAGQRRELPIRAASTIDAALIVSDLHPEACAISARPAAPRPLNLVFCSGHADFFLDTTDRRFHVVGQQPASAADRAQVKKLVTQSATPTDDDLPPDPIIELAYALTSVLILVAAMVVAFWDDILEALHYAAGDAS